MLLIAQQQALHSARTARTMDFIRHSLKYAALGLCALATVANSQTQPTDDAQAPAALIVEGWRPASLILGGGNQQSAVQQMREYTALQHALFHNIDLDPQTDTFLEELWDSLETFNLSRFHKVLPTETSTGRELWVYGSLQQDRYPMGPKPLGAMTTAGTPKVMGDFSAKISSERLKAKKETTYLLQGQAQLGVGNVLWPNAEQALKEIVRMAAGQNPVLHQTNSAAPWHDRYYAEVARLNPKLKKEDLDVLVPIWASYPAVAALIARFGEVEDIVYFDTSLPYRRFTGSFRLLPERMAEYYPHLASHIKSFKRIFQGSMQVQDERGNLMSGSLNSETLRGELSMYVADGRILPVKGLEVQLDAPPIPHDRPWNFNANMQATMSVWGINMHIQQIKAKVQTLSTDDEFKLVARVNQVPKIRIDGKALGLFPTWMAEVPLPAKFYDIIYKFVAAACYGNDGKGVLAGLHFKSPVNKDSANLQLKVALEGLHNFFVQFGMGIVNDRILPNTRSQKELEQLFYDIQQAFGDDLDRFEAALAGGENQPAAPAVSQNQISAN